MRYLKNGIQSDLKNHMVILSGPRQCGKTTFAKKLISQSTSGQYLNWDQVTDRKRIIAQDWNENAQLLVLDEIHKKRGWKNFLKGLYDTKIESLRVLITGSARLELLHKSGDSMFGRYRAWRLHPFCLAEDPLNLEPSARLERLLSQGGFPFPYLAENKDEVARWRNQRWSLLLKEDARELEQIQNIQQLELLAELTKNCAGQLLSYKNLAEDVEVAPKTAKKWVDLLEKIYLIHRIYPYSKSVKRSLSKTPKIYMVDVSDLENQDYGAKLENLVALHLTKRIHFLEDAYGERLELNYIRDREKREVDFIITKNKQPIALIEVKSSRQAASPSLVYYKNKLNINYAIQLDAETTKPSEIRKSIRFNSIVNFLSQPLENRTFWEQI